MTVEIYKENEALIITNNITNLIQIHEYTTNNVVGEMSRDPLVSIAEWMVNILY